MNINFKERILIAASATYFFEPQHSIQFLFLIG